MIDRYTEPKLRRIWAATSIYQSWVDVWLAVMRVQQAQGIIPEMDVPDVHVDARFVCKARIHERTCKHDVVAARRALEHELGTHPAAQFVHVGLTSSDVVDTGLAMTIHRATDAIDWETLRVQTALNDAAETGARCVGRTHGQTAEEMPLSDRIWRWHDAIDRARDDVSTAGYDLPGKISGPVGCHSRWVPPQVEQVVLHELLGTYGGVDVPGQCVPRDYLARYGTALERLSSAFASMALDIRLLAQSGIDEVAEVQTDGQVGSSSMAHKHNPVQCEKICGLARLVRGYSLALQSNADSLWLERDISHSSVERVALPDITTVVHHQAATAVRMLRNLTWDTDLINTRAELHQGSYKATNQARTA